MLGNTSYFMNFRATRAASLGYYNSIYNAFIASGLHINNTKKENWGLDLMKAYSNLSHDKRDLIIR